MKNEIKADPRIFEKPFKVLDEHGRLRDEGMLEEAQLPFNYKINGFWYSINESMDLEFADDTYTLQGAWKIVKTLDDCTSFNDLNALCNGAHAYDEMTANIDAEMDCRQALVEAFNAIPKENKSARAYIASMIVQQGEFPDALGEGNQCYMTEACDVFMWG